MIELKNKALFKTQCYINGEWRNANSNNTLKVNNPYSKAIIGTVPDMRQTECKDAIDAAYNAFQTWKNYAAAERGQILRRWYELQLENLDDLAKLLTIEQGKPLAEAKGEIRYGASFVEWFAEEADVRRRAGRIPGCRVRVQRLRQRCAGRAVPGRGHAGA